MATHIDRLELVTEVLRARDAVLKVPRATREQFISRTIDENLERLRTAEFGRQKYVLGFLLAEQFLHHARETERSRDIDAAMFRTSQHFRLAANDWDLSISRRCIAGFVAHTLAELMESKSPELVASTDALAVGADLCSDDDWIAVTGLTQGQLSQAISASSKIQTTTDVSRFQTSPTIQQESEKRVEAITTVPSWAEFGRPHPISTRSKSFSYYFHSFDSGRDISDAALFAEILTELVGRRFENAGNASALLFARIGKTWSPAASVEGRRMMNLLQASWHLRSFSTSTASQKRLMAITAHELIAGIEPLEGLRDELASSALSELAADDPISKNDWLTVVVRLLAVNDSFLGQLQSQEVAALTNGWQKRTNRQRRPMTNEIIQEVASWRREVSSSENVELRRAAAVITAQVNLLRPLIIETELQALEHLKGVVIKVAQTDTGKANDRVKLARLVSLEDRITESISECFGSLSALVVDVASPFISCIIEVLENAKTQAAEASRPQLSLTLLSDRLPLRLGSLSGRDIALDFQIVNSGNSDAREISLEYSSEALETETRSTHPTALRPADQVRIATSARLMNSVDALEIKATLRWRNDLGMEFEIEERFIAEAERPSRWEFGDSNPYSTNAVSERRFLFGRDEQLDDLRNRLLQGDSVVITGQKRVGKSSLIQVACQEIESQGRFATIVRFAYLQARSSSGFIRNFVDDLSYKISRLVDGISFDSFEPQEDRVPLMAGRRLDEIGLALGGKKIVFVVDDFDELPPALLEESSGDELFNFIRAAAQEPWLSIVFVGSEVMPKMLSRHAARMNTFNSVSVDRIESLQGMANLITRPTIDRLEWSDDAVVSLTQYVDGNPYYAVLLCGELWGRLRDRDRSYVTERDVIECARAFASQAERRHFVHLWGDSEDGMAPESEIADLNIYVLYAVSRLSGESGASRQTDVIDWVQERIEGKSRASIEDRISDLIGRKVLAVRADGLLRVRIPLVNLWFRLGAEENIGDRLRNFVDSARLSDQISDHDLLAIAEGLRFVDRDISEIQVGAWLGQFSDASLRATAFRMLQTLKNSGYFSLQRVEELGRIYRSHLDSGPLARVIRKSANGRSTENVTVIPVFECDNELAKRFSKGAHFPQSSVRLLEDIGQSGTAVDPCLFVVFATFDGTGDEIRRTVRQLRSGHSVGSGDLQIEIVVLTSLSDADAVVVDGDRVARFAMTPVIPSCNPLAVRQGGDGDDDLGISEIARDRLIRQQTDLLATEPGGWNEFGLLIVFDGILPTYSPAIFWKSGRYQGKDWRPLFTSRTRWDGVRPAVQDSGIRRLIDGGEKADVEFKETLRTPNDGSEADKALRASIESAIVKAVASLLNHASGGTLLIGVRNDKSVAGLERDYASFGDGDQNEDGFERHLRQILRRDILELQPTEVDIRFETIDEMQVCRVSCPPARKARFVTDNSKGNPVKRLYVRDGPGSIDISTEGPKMVEFLQSRFPSN